MFCRFAKWAKEEIEQWLKKQLPNAELKEDKNKLSVYFNQFKEYFSGKRQSFMLPLDLYGTKFQKSVWTELQKIPFGETSTYSDIAEKINKPSAFRAVGSAIGANPVMIVIPCHRVIGKIGEINWFSWWLINETKITSIRKEIKIWRGGMSKVFFKYLKNLCLRWTAILVAGGHCF